MADELRDSIAAHLRLELSPETLTVDDVQLLGAMSQCLGVRAAVAYELRRVTTTPTKAKRRTPSRRKTARHATR